MRAWYRCKNCYAWKEFDTSQQVPNKCPSCLSKDSLEKDGRAVDVAPKSSMADLFKSSVPTRKTYKPRN